MSSSAERVQPAGSLRRALLPEIELGLRREAASDLELRSLALGSPKEVLAVLGESEELARAVPKRRAEFAAGRHAASLALLRFGSDEPVPREPSGAPRWPTGFVGSISHGAGLAVAVAGSRLDYRGLGIDVEEWLSEVQAAEISDRILHREELELLSQASLKLPTARRVSLGFSVKESLYKCLNPIAGEFIEFEDAQVVRIAPRTPTSGRIWLSLCRSFSSELPEGMEVSGCYALEPDRVETLIWLSRRHA